MEKIQILAVDDEKPIRRLLIKELGSEHRQITAAADVQAAIEAFKSGTFDVVLLDMRLPDGNGLDLLAQFQELAPEIQVIIITGHADVDNAVQAMKLGAYDYITKPFVLDRLEMIIEKAYQRTCLHRENRRLRHSQTQGQPPKLIGHSKPMAQLRYLIGKVAPAEVPVLLTGESGTGKTVVARVIHAMSQRHPHPLITKNCGTLQKDLMRSELFGYRKGAYTGATESYEGLLAFANKSTLFLDEIGEVSADVQSALLRVIENQTFRKVGDKQEQHVDVRFVFATNRNLTREVEEGRFSEALYHRLNVFNICLPPLRERKEDIPALTEFFLGQLRLADASPRITDRALQCLMAYNWPGNVRELQNVLERCLILSEGGLIGPQTLPKELASPLADASNETAPFLFLKEVERQHIQAVMAHVHGNRTQAAKVLGIGRKTLYRKLQSEKD